MWSSGSINRIHRALELKMQEIIPMKLIDEIHVGDAVYGIHFNEEVVLRYIIEKFGLSDKAKHGTVEIIMTIGGAKLEGGFMHMTIGFNLDGVDSIDPNTDEKVYKNIQSEQQSFPLITLVTKDNSRTYSTLFDHIFDFCNKVRDQVMTATDGTYWNPFLIPEPQDMKSNQICIGRGGASKGPGVLHFCHLCMCTMCTSDEIMLPNQVYGMQTQGQCRFAAPCNLLCRRDIKAQRGIVYARIAASHHNTNPGMLGYSSRQDF
jgi:hypothetical protein